LSRALELEPRLDTIRERLEDVQGKIERGLTSGYDMERYHSH
jgi:hypothetical protein